MNRSSDERATLIRMVREVQNASACTMDFDSMLGRLEEKLQFNGVGQLIFDPPGGRPLTAAEIVDRALQARSDVRQDDQTG